MSTCRRWRGLRRCLTWFGVCLGVKMESSLRVAREERPLGSICRFGASGFRLEVSPVSSKPSSQIYLYSSRPSSKPWTAQSQCTWEWRNLQWIRAWCSQAWYPDEPHLIYVNTEALWQGSALSNELQFHFSETLWCILLSLCHQCILALCISCLSPQNSQWITQRIRSSWRLICQLHYICIPNLRY